MILPEHYEDCKIRKEKITTKRNRRNQHVDCYSCLYIDSEICRRMRGVKKDDRKKEVL